MHALGKLLHAKRVGDALHATSARTTTTAESTALGAVPEPREQPVPMRPPLSFVPEDVVTAMRMDAGVVSDFVQANCVDHFTDIHELAHCLDVLSDGAFLHEARWRVGAAGASAGARGGGGGGGGNDGLALAFPHGYVASIAGRAVARCNTRPAKAGFRPIGRPPAYDARRASRQSMEQLRAAGLGHGRGYSDGRYRDGRDPTHVDGLVRALCTAPRAELLLERVPLSLGILNGGASSSATGSAYAAGDCQVGGLCSRLVRSLCAFKSATATVSPSTTFAGAVSVCAAAAAAAAATATATATATANRIG